MRQGLFVSVRGTSDDLTNMTKSEFFAVQAHGSQLTNTPASEMDALVAFFVQASDQGAGPFNRKERLLAKPTFFGMESFRRLLSNPMLGPDWIQVAYNGQPVDLSKACLWKNVQAKKLMFMDKQLLDDAIAHGAAVVLEGLDILDANINAMIRQIDQRLPCSLSNCEAFFSQKGNEAYGGHRDSDNVLVVQVSGEKRWILHHPQQRRYFGNTPLTVAQMGPVLSDFVMRPGDALFVRAGVPHRCITVTDHSLHLSIDLCDRTPNIEQITHAANSNYNHGVAPAYASAAEVVDHYIAQLKSDGFQAELAQAVMATRTHVAALRVRIGRSGAVRALDKFVDGS